MYPALPFRESGGWSRRRTRGAPSTSRTPGTSSLPKNISRSFGKRKTSRAGGDGLRKGHPRATRGHVGPFVAQFGTYEIQDDVLTLTILVAKREVRPQADRALQTPGRHVNH